MKKMLKDYFSFSKKERIAIIILILLIAVFMALPYFFSVKADLPVIDPALKAFINDKKLQEADTPRNGDLPASADVPNGKMHTETVTLFSFDPNTLSVEGWIRLGVKPRTANTILRYLGKGGRFRKPEDIRKIWGLPKQLADRLLPYVVIENNKRPPGSFTKIHPPQSNEPTAGKTLQPAIIEMNTAGADEWKMLPGIGEVLANRIVHYRERVNGFDSSEQLKKVYGLSDSVFKQILPFLRLNPALLKKLNLNTVSAKALSKRTGIPENVARAIVVYRQQYGVYGTVNDLKKIVFVNDSLFGRIVPHVVVE